MINFINSIFSKERINTGRQYEVDLLRGFTLVILAFTHVVLYLSSEPESGLYTFSDIIASEPGAPVFMIAMGISICFSRNQDAMSLLKRGINLLIGGFLLNLVRSFPYWFMDNGDFFASVPGFFVVDIFQLAGLSFLLFALFKALKVPSWIVFLISVCFVAIGQILMSIPNALDFSLEETYFLNLFLPLNNDYCCFNLLTWFIYPSFGIVLGDLIIHCKNKNKFYLILLILGVIGVVILYLSLFLRYPDYATYYYGGNFYRMGILNTLITLLVDCFLLAFWYFVGKIAPKIIKRFLSFLSKHITVFYVLSWLEIGTLIHLQTAYNIVFSNLALYGIIVGVLVTCALLVYPYQSIINHFKKA